MRKRLMLLIPILFLSCGGSQALIERYATDKETTIQIETIMHVAVPTKAFVKVYKTLKVLECRKKTKTICKKGDSFVSTGSGVSIGTARKGSLLLTAGHVCQSTLSVSASAEIKKYQISMHVRNIYNELRSAKVVYSVNGVESRRDLCLLFAKGLYTKGVLLATSGPKVGDKVFALSAPAGIFHPPTMPIFEGRYSGPIPESDNAMVTLPAVGGSSGSGIFNNQMRLIGILFATHPRFNIVTLSSSYKATADFTNKGFKKFLKMNF